MKVNRTTVYLILMFSFLISFLFNSCDIKDPIAGLEVRLQTLTRTTTITLDFRDANTGNQVSGTTITVFFEGDNKENIISTVNQKINNISTNTGFVNFAIEDHIVPSQNSPVKFIAVVNTSGYLSTSTNITISKEGSNFIPVFLASESAPPNGVISNTETKGTSVIGTGTDQDITVSSGEESNSQGSADIFVPQGTELKDRNGNTLTGDIKTTVTYFNPEDDESLQSFPGGFAVTVSDESGVERDVTFVTGGFAAIEMTVNGVPVESFGPGVEINIDIPPNTINPQTGDPIQPGEDVPLWSYNEDNGKWKFETTLKVPTTSQPNGTYRVTYKNVEHLSWYNIDWALARCEFGSTINFSGSGYSFLVAKIFRIISGSSQLLLSAGVNASDPSFIVENAPVQEAGVTYKVEAYQNDVLIGSLDGITDICAGAYTVPVVGTTTNCTDVNVIVRAYCRDRDPVLVVNPNIDIYISADDGANYILAGTMVNGEITLTCLQLGKDYYFKVLYDGEWYEDHTQITEASYDFDFDLPAEVCDDF